MNRVKPFREYVNDMASRVHFGQDGRTRTHLPALPFLEIVGEMSYPFPEILRNRGSCMINGGRERSVNVI